MIVLQLQIQRMFALCSSSSELSSTMVLICHYVRATAEEAKFTAEANHGNNRWKAGQQRSSSWYSSHTPEGYAT